MVLARPPLLEAPVELEAAAPEVPAPEVPELEPSPDVEPVVPPPELEELVPVPEALLLTRPELPVLPAELTPPPELVVALAGRQSPFGLQLSFEGHMPGLHVW